ncbi:MAG: TetR family transcriptional regulator [Anaerolineales bacterium]|nr:TetR family transcriptional regulator [Anaerolineales bacterium]
MTQGQLSPIRQRARSQVHKLERRQALLDAAWQLFAASTYEAVTMAAVAKSAALAKGTVYLYFPSKEELFLAVCQQQLELWLIELNAALAVVPSRVAASEVAALISTSLTQRLALTRLLAILATVLEQNVSLETALAFKRFLGERLAYTGALLEQRLHFLAAGQGVPTLLRVQALIVGLWHLADPAPVAKKALRQLQAKPFQIQFEAELTISIRALLRGLELETSGVRA